jgi:hypothetical protein
MHISSLSFLSNGIIFVPKLMKKLVVTHGKNERHNIWGWKHTTKDPFWALLNWIL